MSNETIVIVLVILLISVIVLYWLSNKLGNLKKNISKNNQIKKVTKIKEDIKMTIPNEPLTKNNNYVYNAKYNNLNRTLSIYDIIENNFTNKSLDNYAEEVIEQEEVIDKPIKLENNEEPLIKEEKIIEPKIENNYPESIINEENNINSFVIGEITEEKEKPLEEPTEEKENVLDVLLATALIVPKVKKTVRNIIKENYINYKPKENKGIQFDDNVSLNNEKCANFQYDLLPDWLKDLLKRENFNIIVSTDDSITKDSAGIYTPIEKTDERYMICDGTDEEIIEDTFLLNVGRFVDNYLGVLANAPVDEQISCQIFSANSLEWLQIFEKNKKALKKEGITSPDMYFAKTFRDYIIDKEKLKNKDIACFNFIDKSMHILEFHHQKDLVENEKENLEDYQKKEEETEKFFNIYEEPKQEINYYEDYQYETHRSR